MSVHFIMCKLYVSKKNWSSRTKYNNFWKQIIIYPYFGRFSYWLLLKFLCVLLEVCNKQMIEKGWLKKHIKKWVIHKCLGLLKEKQRASVSHVSTPRSQDLAIVESLWKRLKHNKTEQLTLVVEGDEVWQRLCPLVEEDRRKKAPQPLIKQGRNRWTNTRTYSSLSLHPQSQLSIDPVNQKVEGLLVYFQDECY